MKTNPLFTRQCAGWRVLHKAVAVTLLVALLAGLIPPPLVRTVLPAPVAELAEALLPDPAVALAAGNITGTVYYDYNANGTRDTSGTSPNLAVDGGVGGIMVTAYDAAAATIATATTFAVTCLGSNNPAGQGCTGANTPAVGSYTLSSAALTALAAGTALRIEFTNLPTGYNPSAQGTNNATSVRFVTTTAGALTSIDFGVLKPSDYSQNNPRLAVPVMRVGSNVGSTTLGLESQLYGSATGTTAGRQDATPNQIGATWGIGYQRQQKQLFTSAFLKRYTGLGPQGPGGLYVLDYSNAAAATLVRSLTLQGVTPANGGAVIDLGVITRTVVAGGIAAGAAGDYQLSNTSNTLMRDLDAFAKVGKVAYGDIDVDETGNNLWLVNLNQRALIQMDVSGAVAALPSTVNQYPILSLPSAPTCPGGELRPWALAFRNSKGYLGVVCDASGSQDRNDLEAYVLTFDPTNVTTGFSVALTVPLTYTREAAQNFGLSPGPITAQYDASWNPWADTWAQTSLPLTGGRLNYAQPILSDIEFMPDGAMILGFSSRFAEQSARGQLLPVSGNTATYAIQSSGDIVKACAINSTFVLESAASCPENDTGQGGLSQANDGFNNTGEFFYGDSFFFSGNTGAHLETANGALALLPGSNEVVSSAFDPFATIFTEGLIYLNTQTGARSTRVGWELDAASSTTVLYYSFGKGNSIGDIEILSDPAPIQIGNRVWNDADRDGIQDPGEPPIASVVVSLIATDTTTVLATATTDANGNYYFSSATGTSTASARYGIIGLTANTPGYTVRVDTTQAVLANLALTNVNAPDTGAGDGGANADARDSDATLTGSNANIAVATAGAGFNNHTYDFGFAPAGTIQIVKNAVSNDGSFTFTSADAQLDAVSITTVSNTGNSGTAFTKNAGTYTISEDAPAANWALTSLSCTGDTDNGSVVTLASRQVAIDLDVGENIVCTFTNAYTPPPGSISVTKQVVTSDGSNPVVAGTFNISVSCPGSTPTPSASQTVAAGASVTFGNIAAGTVCTVSENTLSLPAAPSGYTWVNSLVTPSSVTVVSGATQAVTARNMLAPQVTASGVLTITKSVIGNPGGVSSYAVTINGPGGYVTNTTVTAGVNKVLTGLAQGVYTVTESSPGVGWTTTYTATPGTGGASRAVVNLTSTAIARTTAGNITGKVYQDYNSNGVLDTTGVTPNFAIDSGLAGVIVTAYDVTGAVVGTPQTTNATGDYTINPGAVQGPYRVEFSNLPSGYEPTMHGTGNGSSTQFVSAPAGNINFGVVEPCDYCQSNPLLAVPLMSNGSGVNNTLPGLVAFPYSSSGSTAPTTVLQASQIGSSWGMGYQRTPARMFVSAFLKRQTGFKDGPGYVYTFNRSGTTLSAGSSFNLQGITPANGGPAIDLGSVCRRDNTDGDPDNNCAPLGGSANDYLLPAGTTTPHVDLDAYAKIGKVSYGDIDVDEENQTLWLVNLYQNALISVDISGSSVPGTVNQYPLSTLGAPTCSDFDGDGSASPTGDLHPFALKFYRGKGYLGAICDAVNSRDKGDLHAFVFSFDPTNPGAGLTQVLIFSLNYKLNSANAPALNFRWWAWTNTWAQSQADPSGLGGAGGISPEPILSDIEFSDNGSMILGFMDRHAHQQAGNNFTAVAGSAAVTFVQAYGDILKVCNVNGSYVMEGTSPSCPVVAKGTANANDGISNNGEFFVDTRADTGVEAFMGAMAVYPGIDEVSATFVDPAALFSGGLAWWDTTTPGARNRNYTIYPNDPDGGLPYAGKGNGLGDMEILCDAAPIEIGNRVWNDYDGDGVQDPGEPGIANVTVSRQGPTNTVTVNTDANGLYYFGGLQTHTLYTLTINTLPAGLTLSPANVQALAGASVSSNHAISDTRDSDATLIGGKALIYHTTGSAGQNNHGLDFGFSQPVSGQVNITNTAPLPPTSYALSKQLNTPDPVRVGDDITFTIRITNTGSTAITALPLRDLYDTGSLLYLSANMPPNDAINDGQLDWSDLTTSFGVDLAPNASFTVTTVFFARSDTSILPGGATINTARVLITPTKTVTAPVRIEAPTAVALASHSAIYDLSSGVTLRWATASEAEVVGFHLLRRELGGGGWVRLTSDMILAQLPGQATGASYSFTDADVQFGHTYLYLVEVVDGSGNASRRELGLVVAGSRVLLPLVAR